MSFTIIGGIAVSEGPISRNYTVSASGYDEKKNLPPYGLNQPSQQDIIDFFVDHPFDLGKSTVYTKDYSLSAPYAQGDISAADRTQALNALNFCRYIAGIPADVELKNEYNLGAQVGQLVNAANGRMTHYPSKPKGMTDQLFSLQANGKSNLYYSTGGSSLSHAALTWVHDTDESNIEYLGHRMWCLNPDMKYTGFGHVSIYSGMYSIDTSRNGKFTGDYVAWPAKNTPYELYHSGFGGKAAFSIHFSTDYETTWQVESDKYSYDNDDGKYPPPSTEVKVVAKSRNTGKKWVLTEQKNLYNDNYFTSDNECYLSVKSNDQYSPFGYYGQPGPYIVFGLPNINNNDTVDITITGMSKKERPVTVNYSVHFFSLESAKLNRTKVNLGVGENYQLNVRSAALYSYDRDKAVSWSSSNSKVAVVSNGKIKAKAKGTAEITCKTKNGRTFKCTVIVKNAPKKLNLNAYNLRLGVGERFSLNSWINEGAASDKRAFVSTDNGICYTSGKGELVAKKPGTAKITVKTYNGVTAVCNVTVKKAPTKLNLNAKELVLGVGESFKLNSWVNEGEASLKRAFSSTSNNTCYTSGSGYLVAKAVGQVYITVKTYNGVYATCKVRVKKAPTKLNLNKYDLTLKEGQYFHLNSWITEGTASNKRAFASTDNGICYTNARGDLKGIKKGKAVITVKTYNGVTAKCNVTVV